MVVDNVNILFYIAVTSIRINLENMMHCHNIKVTKEYKDYETMSIKETGKNEQFAIQ